MEPVTALERMARGLEERTLRWLVYGTSALVVGLVAALISFPRVLAAPGLDVSLLPGFHAGLNATATVLLVLGWLRIRRGRVEAHRRLMMTAFFLSAIFLVSYVVYHSQAEPTTFGGEGWIRPVYYFTLITHIVLAPVVLPLALFTVLRGLRDELGRHRRIARWTLPLWLYVTVTGVLVYLFMVPYY